MADLELYKRETLEAMTVDDLVVIAAAKDVQGYSSMLKEDLVNAIVLAQADQTLALVTTQAIIGGTDLEVWIVSLERRMRSIELHVAALDERTRPPTQILGSD